MITRRGLLRWSALAPFASVAIAKQKDPESFTYSWKDNWTDDPRISDFRKCECAQIHAFADGNEFRHFEEVKTGRDGYIDYIVEVSESTVPEFPNAGMAHPAMIRFAMKRLPNGDVVIDRRRICGNVTISGIYDHLS